MSIGPPAATPAVDNRIPNGALPWAWSIRRMLASPTCRVATLAVFAGILAIEAVIFVPAYLNREQALLAQARDHAETVMTTAQQLVGSQAVLADLNRLVAHDTLIEGISVLDRQGRIVAQAGAEPDHGGLQTQALPAQDAMPMALRTGDHIDVYLPGADPSAETAATVAVICMDGNAISEQLLAFAWRIGALVLLISTFVSMLALIIVSYIAIRPVLLLRDRLIHARGKPSAPGLQVETSFVTSELSEAAEALNDLLSELARNHDDAIANREERLSDFAKASSDWFWEMDEHLRFSYFSDRFTEITGVPQEALLGKTRQQTGIPNVDPAAWQEHLDNLDARRPFRNFVHPRTKDSGELVWLAINGLPVFDDNGTFLGYRGTGADITPIRRAEEAMQNAVREAERANRAKSQFLAAMSHELRTPLNAIIGFSETIQQQLAGPIGSPQYLEYAGYIHSSGAHLLHLVNQILDLSKVEAGKTELEEEIVAPDDCIEEAVGMLATWAAERSITVDHRRQRHGARILADASKLRQILLNLLSNALKFTPEGGYIVTGSERTPDGGMAFYVEDNGCGIAKTDLKTVLSPFGQVRSGSTSPHEGTGLGLPLCKGYAELHGGAISIDSTPGRGTRVTITMPTARVIDTEDDTAFASTA